MQEVFQPLVMSDPPPVGVIAQCRTEFLFGIPIALANPALQELFFRCVILDYSPDWKTEMVDRQAQGLETECVH